MTTTVVLPSLSAAMDGGFTERSETFNLCTVAVTGSSVQDVSLEGSRE